MSYELWIALIFALLVIASLAFYAGKLLFALNKQSKNQLAMRQQRVDSITESVQVIAMAMEQQQCNLSEGAIRLVNLLHSLPVKDVPDCQIQFPALYELYDLVKDLPTHEERKALTRQVRKEQDDEREEHESRLETAILKEIAPLKSFQIAI
ncbi:DUF2489 domain-containing protein [Aestuariibacter sp. AA17]|uniref:DUF2489 domain-containing protein n=1 Tax=Fluctibacter corallii TaxID=2984329 RepID=A0ABT3AE11_9ALTE|nr:DUF2489 domain-containing protein [Aestuariibacter sp. AA17]MCV2886552.1 DUF2489 domain-containing protein [Aestuariibacter sp. AA17]